MQDIYIIRQVVDKRKDSICGSLKFLMTRNNNAFIEFKANFIHRKQDHLLHDMALKEIELWCEKAYMSASVLLDLLNELRKSDKCEACRAFYSFSATSLINSIRQEHEC